MVILRREYQYQSNNMCPNFFKGFCCLIIIDPGDGENK